MTGSWSGQSKPTVAACARWMRLPGALENLEARVANEFARDSKKSSREFDAGQREREKSALEGKYGPVIEHALAWSREVVEPHATLPRDWKSLALFPLPT